MTEQQLPEGWQMVKFGDIAKHISKRVDPTETDLEVYVGLEHLDPDSLKIKRHGVPSDVAGQKLLVEKGQIIFGKRRAYQRKVAVADWDCICSAHAMVLEAISEKVIPDFLSFFMQSDAFMKRAVAISEGSLSPTIKWKALLNQTFQLPDLSKQKQMLDEFRAVEVCLEKTNRTLSSVYQLRESYLDRDLFKIYSSGSYIHLGDVCEKITDGSHQKVERDENGDIPFLFVSCILNGRIVWDNVDRINENTYNLISKGREVDEGDVLFTAVGSYGNAICMKEKIKIGFQRHIAYLKPNHSAVIPSFIELWLNSRYGKWHSDRLAIGNAQKTITLRDLAKFPFPHLSVSKQQEISDTYKRISALIETLERKKESLQSLKKALIN
ncbi:restriction endonuclease subunit S [Vibrio ostreicida]|uniref:restriction endonuclease subunit S n=1 Tax=Vibrio ostreicida TaxID=526588 RepID=UPI0009708D5C|nr:restriction endonuclease subunit S [Vibrio ostreicida]